MNRIGKLIKSKVIPFVENFIKHYKEIGLNEVESAIICKLYYLYDEGDQFLNVDELYSQVTISYDQLTNIIMNLTENNYLTIEINDGKEEFNLDGTFDKLGNVLDTEKAENNSNERRELISLSTMYIETTFGKPCSAADLIIINNWADQGYSLDSIKEAVLSSFKLKKCNLRYVDAVLANKKERQVDDTIEVDPETKALLESLYVKK